MRIVAICIWFALFYTSACQTKYLPLCTIPTIDPYVPIVAPSAYRLDSEIIQNPNGPFEYTLAVKYFPIWNGVGVALLKNAFDPLKPVNMQATSIFDTKTWCSPSASDITIQCPNNDYVHQFMDSRWNSTFGIDCTQNFQGSFTREEFLANSYFNSVKGTYDIQMRIIYYLQSNVDSQKWWSQSQLVVFSIQHEKIGQQEGKPMTLSSTFSPEAIMKDGNCYMHGRESIISNPNNTYTQLYGTSLKITKGAQCVNGICPQLSEVCRADLKARNRQDCESYLLAPAQIIEGQISKSGTFFYPNGDINFQTRPSDFKTVCDSAGAVVKASSDPMQWLYDTANLFSIKSPSTEGHTYGVLKINAYSAFWKVANAIPHVYVGETLYDGEISRRRLLELILNPPASMLPASYKDYVCIIVKLVDDGSGFWTVLRGQLTLKLTWDLVPKSSSRAEQEIDTSGTEGNYSGTFIPFQTSKKNENILTWILGIIQAILEYLSSLIENKKQ